MIHAHNGIVPFDRRFYSEFIAQLSERHYPHCPDPPWCRALYTAAAIAPCDTPSPLHTGNQLHNKNTTWRVGSPEPTRCSEQLRTGEINAAANRWLDRHCPQFSGAAP